MAFFVARGGAMTSEVLDAEVAAALAAAGLRWRRWECVSTIRTAEIGRITYRIDLEDGQGGSAIKARRLANEEIAALQAKLRRELPAAYTKVIERHGRVLLEEWVDGTVLANSPTEANLRDAGVLLADLHGRSSLGTKALPMLQRTKGHRAAALRALRAAVHAGLLRGGDATAAARRLRSLDPGFCCFGLAHLDFCGENIVLDRAGKLRVVDNERVGIEALGYDLGRSWYRWTLSADAWKTFLDAYRSALSVPEPTDAFAFWQIVAAARAVEIRLRVAPKRVSAALACLRSLLA